MFISKIHIGSFGKFNDFSLDLNKGFNVLEAGNEFGKSTISAFITFVLYGFVSAKNKRIEDNDKKHYIPWGSDHAGGYIELTDGNTVYRIERKVILPSREQVSVTDITNLREYKNITEPGKYFFGIGNELFAKSIYFTQISSPLNQDETIADSIRNICVSSDEQISIDKAKKRMNDLKTSIRNKQNNGCLPAAEQEYASIEQKYADAIRISNEIKETDEKIKKERENLSSCEKELKKFKDERHNYEKYEAYKQILRLKLLRDAEAESKKKYESSLEWFKDGKMPDESLLTELRDGYKKYDALCGEVKEKRDDYDNFVSNVNKIKMKKDEFSEDGLNSDIASYKSSAWIFFCILFILAAAGSALFFFVLKNITLAVASLVVSVVFLILWITKITAKKSILKKYNAKDFEHLNDILSQIRLEKKQEKDENGILESKKKEIKKAEDEAEKQKFYLIGLTEQISSEFSYQDTIQIRWQQIIDHVSECRKLYSMYTERKHDKEISFESADIEALKQMAEGAVQPTRTLKEIDSNISYSESRKSIIESSILGLEKKRSALEASYTSVSVLETKKEAIKNKIEEYKTDYAALEAALVFLDRSSDILKSSVIPGIEKYASEAINGTTNGKYGSVKLQSDFSIDLAAGDEPKSLEYMSAGTKELTYIILRNALIKLYFDGKSVPVIIDDALVRVDDPRAKEAFKLINCNACVEQVILFSSLKRDKKLINEAGIRYNSL